MRFLSIIFSAPGVIVHELNHALWCVMLGVKIYRFVPLRFRDPPGFVEHAEPETFSASLFISLGPLLGNTVVGLFLASFVTSRALSGYTLLALWLAVSIARSAPPSDGDVRTLGALWKQYVRRNWLMVITWPLVAVAWLISLFARPLPSLLYGIAITVLGAWYLKTPLI